MTRLAAIGLALVLASVSAAGDHAVDSQDLARALSAAIAGLSPETPPELAQEHMRFLVSHGPEAAGLLEAAQRQAQGIQLSRIITVREELAQQRRANKLAKSNPFRDFLIAEPTLRFLLALGWAVAVVVAAKVFRSHLAPSLHGWIDTHRIYVDPRTLLGIERLIGGLIILVGLNIGISLFLIQGIAGASQSYFDALRARVFNAGFFVACGYGLLKVVDIGFDTAGKRLQSAGAVDEALVAIARNVVKAVLACGTVLLVLENFGVEMQSLLLAMAILGLAAALASRGILSNLFSMVSIMAQRSFAVGDRIQVGGMDGYVESVGFMSTKLRTQEGTLAVVPNRIAGDSTINNLSRKPHTRKTFAIRLRTDCPTPKVERCLAVLREILRSRSEVQDFWAHLAEMTPDALEVQVSLWSRRTDPRSALEDLEEMHLEIKRRFDAEGITEHLKGGNA